jgi:hypothetical protein
MEQILSKNLTKKSELYALLVGKLSGVPPLLHPATDCMVDTLMTCTSWLSGLPSGSRKRATSSGISPGFAYIWRTAVGLGVVGRNVCSGVTSLSPGEQIAEASNTMTGPCVRPTTSLVSLRAKIRQFGVTEEKGIFR